MKPGLSLRTFLLAGILLPVGLIIAINAVSLYRKTLDAVNTAYDRTLLASAKSIGEQLDVTGYDEAAVLRATVPYSALEAFEADVQTRMFYRISDLHGRSISGFADLPPWQGRIRHSRPTPPWWTSMTPVSRQHVRVAVLLQPVASPQGRGMAVIQVAETLELRRRLTRRILIDFLWQQAALVRPDRAGGDRRGAARHAAGAPAERGAAVAQRGRPDARCRPPARRANCCRWWTPPTASCRGWRTCWTTRSASCATPRTSCARRSPS